MVVASVNQERIIERVTLREEQSFSRYGRMVDKLVGRKEEQNVLRRQCIINFVGVRIASKCSSCHKHLFSIFYCQALLEHRECSCPVPAPGEHRSVISSREGNSYCGLAKIFDYCPKPIL